MKYSANLLRITLAVKLPLTEFERGTTGKLTSVVKLLPAGLLMIPSSLWIKFCNKQQVFTISTAKSSDTFNGRCKIRHLFANIPNVHST